MTRSANNNIGPVMVTRTMMVSPLQNEMLHRNRSRIFITVAGESVIDSVLFQGYRAIESFIDVAKRAITMAGLHDPTGEVELKAAFDHNPTAGFMQQHLVSRGWLENDDNQVVDVIVEVQLQKDSLPDINMKTYDAVTPIEGSFENPLFIFCGVQDLYPQDDIQMNPQPEPEVAARQNGDDGTSKRGRVLDPINDGRLKANRDRVTAMARQGDQGDESGTTSQTAAQGSTARMAGRPGRVARPWDGRLKHNRAAVSASAGGR